jgi:hypothetical protein
LCGVGHWAKPDKNIVWNMEEAIQQTMTERIALLPTVVGSEDKCDAEFNQFSYILRTLLIRRWMGWPDVYESTGTVEGRAEL